MNLFTEKESLNGSDFFAFKLRNLYNTDNKLFYQVADYLPDFVYLKKMEQGKWSYTFNNLTNTLSKAPEMEELFYRGEGYLKSISCPVLLEKAFVKQKELLAKKSIDNLCVYYQGVTLYGKKEHTYTTKLLIDNFLQFNITKPVSELPQVGKVLTSVFDVVLKDQYTWQRFMSLTKQEKLIIRLLAYGKTNKDIGEQLFVTVDTVKTHRRNIYKKLDVHTISELVRVSIALELIEDL